MKHFEELYHMVKYHMGLHHKTMEMVHGAGASLRQIYPEKKGAGGEQEE